MGRPSRVAGRAGTRVVRGAEGTVCPMSELLPFESAATRSHEEVLAAYHAAEDLDDWLRHELAVFLDTGHDTAEDLAERVEGMLAMLEDRLEETQATVRDPDAMLGLEIEVLGPDGTRAMVLSEVPHPVELLWTVAHHAYPGDVVRVSHHYTNNVFSAARVWPFGVDDAVLLATPDPRSRAEAGTTTAVIRVPPAAVAAGALLAAAVGFALGRRRAR